jgi:glycosyltransferase involved in cell wall biosynthesis
MTAGAVVDVAGASMGGAARWTHELTRFLGATGSDIEVIGRERSLTAAWLVGRERLAGRADRVVAANNVSFALARGRRTVLLRNALHVPYPGEEHLVRLLSRTYRARSEVVRRLLARADLIVVPCSAMAQRVCARVPAVRDRLVVRAHPVSPVGPRVTTDPPFILVPVLPSPYKNLVPHLRALVAATGRVGMPIEIRVTADRQELPGDLAGHPRVVAVGHLSHRHLGPLWCRATAAFYPSSVEAFGYPLAEARVYGLPVLAPDSGQARDIAGAALVPYRLDRPDSLAEAVRQLDRPVVAEPGAFDASAYFRWLFDLPRQRPHQEHHATAV